jgi:hypothetical protein
VVFVWEPRAVLVSGYENETMTQTHKDPTDDGPECSLIRGYLRQQERLRQTLHQAIGDCCFRDGTISSWICSPSEAEERIFDALVELNFN